MSDLPLIFWSVSLRLLLLCTLLAYQCYISAWFICLSHCHLVWEISSLETLLIFSFCFFGLLAGNEQGLITAVIRHLDHKNVVHDPKVKSDIIQISAGLVRQLRSQNVVPEIGVISDLCRHLRKSLQATVDVVGPEESGWNSSLQSSIQNCLLEIAKGVRLPLSEHIFCTE